MLPGERVAGRISRVGRSEPVATVPLDRVMEDSPFEQGEFRRFLEAEPLVTDAPGLATPLHALLRLQAARSRTIAAAGVERTTPHWCVTGLDAVGVRELDGCRELSRREAAALQVDREPDSEARTRATRSTLEFRVCVWLHYLDWRVRRIWLRRRVQLWSISESGILFDCSV